MFKISEFHRVLAYKRYHQNVKNFFKLAISRVPPGNLYGTTPFLTHLSVILLISVWNLLNVLWDFLLLSLLLFFIMDNFITGNAIILSL